MKLNQGLTSHSYSATLLCFIANLLLTSLPLQGLSAQHYIEELSVTDHLLQLVDPGRVSVAADDLAAAQEEHGGAAQQYMAAVRSMMQMSSSSLADVPGKVVFCRQRIAQVREPSERLQTDRKQDRE